jgi:hypothetical protein
MPKTIDPLNPEELKAAIAENKASEQPVATQPVINSEFNPELVTSQPAETPSVPSQQQAEFSPTVNTAPSQELSIGTSNAKRKRLILIGAIIFIVVAIGVTTWLSIRHVTTAGDGTSKSNASPKAIAAIDTRGWHTTKNNKLHYSYKYPADDEKRIWRFYENDMKQHFYTGVESGLATTPKYYPLSVFSAEVMPVGSTDYKANIEYFSSDNIEEINQQSVKDFTIEKENVTKNNVKGTCYKRVFVKTSNWDFTTCWFQYKDNGYLLSIGGYGSDNTEQEYKNTGDYSIPALGQKMYDSFQFI